MRILIKNPEEIEPTDDFEDEISGLRYYNPNYSTIVDKAIKAVFDACVEVDIDEALADFVGGTPQMDGWLKEYTKAYKLFSKFLQEK